MIVNVLGFGLSSGKITVGFIITGPNIASQDLLFEQLAERVCTATQARFVRLRASEAPNLKAALKKIIRDATAKGVNQDEEEGAVEVTQGVSFFSRALFGVLVRRD